MNYFWMTIIFNICIILTYQPSWYIFIKLSFLNSAMPDLIFWRCPAIPFSAKQVPGKFNVAFALRHKKTGTGQLAFFVVPVYLYNPLLFLQSHNILISIRLFQCNFHNFSPFVNNCVANYFNSSSRFKHNQW